MCLGFRPFAYEITNQNSAHAGGQRKTSQFGGELCLCMGHTGMFLGMFLVLILGNGGGLCKGSVDLFIVDKQTALVRMDGRTLVKHSIVLKHSLVFKFNNSTN